MPNMLNDNSAEISRLQQSVDQLEQENRRWQDVQIFDAQGQIYTVPGMPTGGFDAGGPDQPFQLSVVNTGTSEAPVWKTRVKYSTLANATPTTPTPDDNGDYEFAFVAGNKIYGEIVIDGTTGAITSRTLVSQSTAPVDTDTDFYVEIGQMTQTGSGETTERSAVNARYGPIDAQICRNWFSNPPSYGVTFTSGSGGGGGGYYYY